MSDHKSIDEQFLPLDSTSKQPYQYANRYKESTVSDQNLITNLQNKITELQKTYMLLQKNHQKRIKQLREQLCQKSNSQSLLHQELYLLTKQFQSHKNQIQKISQQIKKSLFQNSQNVKIKSNSPQTIKANSPKRLIKNSIQINKKQFVNKNQSQQIISIKETNQAKHKQNTQVKNKESNEVKQITQNSSYNKYENQKTLKSNQECSLATISSKNQTQNGRKKLYSPTNSNNGPSPKKKINFNSNKQLDLFSKPIITKQHPIMNTTIFSSRKLNGSPLQKKSKQHINSSKQILQNFIKTQNKVIIKAQDKAKQNLQTITKQQNQSNKTNQQNKRIIFSPKRTENNKKISPLGKALLSKKSSQKNLIKIQQQHKKQIDNQNNNHHIQNIKKTTFKPPILNDSTKLLKYSPLNRQLKSFSPKNKKIAVLNDIHLKIDHEKSTKLIEQEKSTKLTAMRQKPNPNKLFQ